MKRLIASKRTALLAHHGKYDQSLADVDATTCVQIHVQRFSIRLHSPLPPTDSRDDIFAPTPLYNTEKRMTTPAEIQKGAQYMVSLAGIHHLR
jgi:hypothetical protein